jgi:hypothetical protein
MFSLLNVIYRCKLKDIVCKIGEVSIQKVWAKVYTAVHNDSRDGWMTIVFYFVILVNIKLSKVGENARRREWWKTRGKVFRAAPNE